MEKLILLKIRYFTVFFFLAVLILFSGIEVSASEKGSTLQGKYEVSNVTFHIYKIGTVNKKNEIMVDKPYDDYPIDYHGDFEQTLETYIKQDNIPSLFDTQTDKSGNFTFSHLTSGVYLVCGNISETDGKTYTPISTKIFISDEVKENEVVIKYNVETSVQTIDISVLKIWKDNNFSQRPQEISVALLKNGAIQETIKLNQKNNWQYRWHNLESKYEWLVSEDSVPDGYTAQITHDSNKFVITNTLQTKQESNNNPVTTVYSNTDGKLPQTGQMNLPILILVTVGIVLVIVGTIVRKKE